MSGLHNHTHMTCLPSALGPSSDKGFLARKPQQGAGLLLKS